MPFASSSTQRTRGVCTCIAGEMQSGDDFAFGGYQRDLPPHLSHSAPAPQVRTPAMLCLNHMTALVVPNAI